MNCDEAQDLLNPLIDNELPLCEVKAVTAHFEHCEACQLEYRLIDDLHQTLAGVPRYPVPDSLAIQVTEQITNLEGTQRLPCRWRRWATLTGSHVAAALAGVVIFLSVSSLRDNPTRLQDNLIGAHIRSLMEQNLTQVTTGDSHSVKPWFAGKVDYAPPVYDLKADGFPLIGGRIDRLNGQNVAVLVYQRRKHWINLFIAVASADTRQAEQAQWNRNGYHVVSAPQGDFIYWSVSDLSADELGEFLRLVLANT